jgi:S1/P1 Nuclease
MPRAVMERTALMLSWLALSSVPALSWNGFGHMEVAAVAWDRLSDKPQLRARITELLKRNPLYDSWTRDAPDDLREKVGFMRAATWPDIIKGDGQHVEDGAPGSHGNRPTGTPDDSRNIGYSDNLMHKYWHFIDEPFSPDRTPLQQPERPNAQTQIIAFRAALASSSGVSDEVRSYDLTWLLHLVGDVHQPLHATSRFTAAHRDGDEGANLVKIRCGERTEVFCRTGELHAFWDDLLGPNEGPPDRVIHAQGDLADPDINLTSITDEAVWIHESFEAAQAVAYAAPIPTDDEPASLTDTYKRNALAKAEERVALAGARLAKLLESALQSPPESALSAGR